MITGVALRNLYAARACPVLALWAQQAQSFLRWLTYAVSISLLCLAATVPTAFSWATLTASPSMMGVAASAQPAGTSPLIAVTLLRTLAAICLTCTPRADVGSLTNLATTDAHPRTSAVTVRQAASFVGTLAQSLHLWTWIVSHLVLVISDNYQLFLIHIKVLLGLFLSKIK